MKLILVSEQGELVHVYDDDVSKEDVDQMLWNYERLVENEKIDRRKKTLLEQQFEELGISTIQGLKLDSYISHITNKEIRKFEEHKANIEAYEKTIDQRLEKIWTGTRLLAMKALGLLPRLLKRIFKRNPEPPKNDKL